MLWWVNASDEHDSESRKRKIKTAIISGCLLALGLGCEFAIDQRVFAQMIFMLSVAILALFGMINLWIAVAVGDMGLTLAVILNAMRLGKIRSLNESFKFFENLKKRGLL